NHLDLQAKDVLLEALQQYTGTVIFVSHDRAFIDGLATRIVHITPGERASSVENYPGNYEEYRYHLDQQAAAASAQPARSQGTAPPPAAAAAEGRRKRVNPQRQQALRNEITALEAEISGIEARLKELEAALADEATFRDQARAQRTTAEYESANARRSALYAEWEEKTAA